MPDNVSLHVAGHEHWGLSTSTLKMYEQASRQVMGQAREQHMKESVKAGFLSHTWPVSE